MSELEQLIFDVRFDLSIARQSLNDVTRLLKRLETLLQPTYTIEIQPS
jgi:hypothetical protein